MCERGRESVGEYNMGECDVRVLGEWRKSIGVYGSVGEFWESGVLSIGVCGRVRECGRDM